jgi:hypothetical protein
MSDQRVRIGTTWVTLSEARQIEAFKRFLAEVGQAPARPRAFQPHRTKGRLWREHIGWVPYVLGRFFDSVGPWPPEGYGNVPLTAWTFPG